MTADRLGFAGLGRMGAPMSARLVAAGYRLAGFDPLGARQRLPDSADTAESIIDLARYATTVFLSVPDGKVSTEVCREIASADGRVTSIVVDLSTIGIAAAKECAATLAEAGVTYVDAPVSGGIAGAESGSLAMMVGATKDVFNSLKPFLDVLARNCFRVGDEPGHGQAMKLLNNYVSAAALAATCEATVFGEKLGLDLAGMVEVLNVSSGRSAASQDKFPRSIVPRTYDFGFAGALMTKDVTLYLENAEASGVPHSLATAVAATWQRFNAAHPDADFTYIHKFFEDGEV